MNHKFAERLKELREEKGLSMKLLGGIINVSDAAISNWENGVNEPKLTYLIALAEYFNVTTDYLCGLEDK